jgi:CheY-like chemotaxis protein
MEHAPVLLIVDDQPLFLDLHANMLRPKGYNVVTAPDAARGFTEAKRLLPNLILLDVEMPGEDGFALCGRLKADPTTARIPIIMLTATQNQKLIERAFQAGAEATVLKSMNVERLLNIIKVVLETEKLSPDELAQRRRTLQ